MSNNTWILDPGHGGMIGAEYYQTNGKQSPEIKPGFGIYEGEFNRDIVFRVLGMALRANVDVIPLVSSPDNISLKDRIKIANEIKRNRGYCQLISVHANAAGKGKNWNKAQGYRVFYKKKSPESVNLAECLNFNLHTRINDLTPARPIAEANFAMFRPAMPAVLLEAAFMTNKDDAMLLASNKFRWIIANAIYNTIMDYEWRS